MLARLKDRHVLACFALAVLALGLRVERAIFDHGVVWPDEIYQSLEQAHRAAFGTGIVPWEWEEGVRSWVFPGFIAGCMRLFDLLGVRDGLVLVCLLRVVIAVLGFLGLLAAARLARALAGELAELLTWGIGAAFPMLVLYGGRAMSEIAVLPLVTVPFLITERDGARPRDAAIGGAMFALGCFVRFQVGVAALVFFFGLLLRKRFRDALACAGGAIPVAALGGLLDALTWGEPFHSLLAYARFHMNHGSAAWGVDRPAYYIDHLASANGLIFGIAVAGVCFAWIEPRARVAILAVVADLAAHSAFEHKEFRYALTSIPLAIGLAGIGIARALEAVSATRRAPAVFIGIVVAVGIYRGRTMTFEDIGMHVGNRRGKDALIHVDEGATLGVALAGRHRDLCGLYVEGVPPAWTGGYAYLHRDVPYYFDSRLAYPERANYLVVRAPRLPEHYQKVDEAGEFWVLRREGPCRAPPPGYSPRL